MNNFENFDVKKIDLRSVLKDLINNFWVIILAVLSVYFIISGIYSITFQPEYTSSALLSVNISGNNGGVYSSLNLTKDMAGVFEEAFKSNILKGKISETLGVDEINGDISLELLPETNLITLNVVSPTPENSYSIINAALKNYDTVSDYLFSNARIDVLKKPTIPTRPSNNNPPALQIKYAMLVAALCSMVAIIIFSYMRSTVKNSDYAKDQLDGRIIGVIPFIKKQFTSKEKFDLLFKKEKPKKSVLITSFMLGVPFIEAVKKVSTVFESHIRRKGSKVILITSSQENEGKSSLVANLALSFAEKGHKVLLIDCDLKKPAMYKIFDKKIENEKSLTNCISENISLNEIIYKERPNLYCIYQYNGVSKSSKYLTTGKFKEIVETAKKECDYVFIDTPPMSVSVDAEAILDCVDTAAVVVRQDWAEVGIINDISDIIKKSGVDFAGFILNAFSNPLFK